MTVQRKNAGQSVNFRGRFGDFLYNTDTSELRFLDGTTLGGVGIGGAGSPELPTGGAEDEVLAKNSGTNYDVKWMAVSGGSGLTHPQVLARGLGI